MAPTSVEQTLTRKVAKRLAPPPKQTVSEWADAERRLSSEASAEPGRWDTDRAPFQRGIMDAREEDGVKTIVIMSSAQVGKSELILNTIGFHIDRDPAPMLLVQPTLQFAEEFSKDRIAPMLRDTPALQNKVKDPRARDSGNTLLKKNFSGGHLTLAGANSPASLAGKPIRIVMCDEVDRFPRSAGSEGDPVKLAQKRTDTFFNSLTILCSTPTIEGQSRIQEEFEASDQRRFHVPCPLCNEPQILQFSSLKWELDPNGSPVNVRYACAHCRAEFDDSQKDWMLLNGKWIAGAPFKGIAGFHISALYSPWKHWVKLVTEYEESKKSAEAEKVFVNTALGETWKIKGEAPEWKRLYEGRELYKAGTVPDPVIFLTCGVDVQKDRLEYEIVGWGKDRQSWSIESEVIPGDTALAYDQPGSPWAGLDRLLMLEWMKKNGQGLRLRMMAVDSGFNTQHVYNWVRRHPVTRVRAVKGNDSMAVPMGHPSAVDLRLSGKRVKRGIQVWPVGVSVLKAELYSWLKLERPTDGVSYPAGFCHFPEYDEEFFQQLTAEALVQRESKAKKELKRPPKFEWVKLRDRNEALDCRVYASYAAIAVGRDRYTPEQWEAQLGEYVPPPAPGQKAAAPTPKKEKKRRESSFW